jgi:pyrimidine operon attenuation protein / uracil phosphoribosyltransferase
MQLPDPEKLLHDVSEQIRAKIEALGGIEHCALVGVHTGGVWIMQRVLSDIGEMTNGTLDAAFYRDDYAKRGLKNTPKPANIRFEVQGKHIILIDDIFYTGRTTRAAMNELFDYGRPASITLAVLIDRGGAELPISPHILGASLALKASQNLQLTQDTTGKLHLALEETAENRHA